MPQPLASQLGPLAMEAFVTQPASRSDVREIGDRPRSQRPIFGVPTQDKKWSATGSSTSNHKSARVPLAQNSQADPAAIINTDLVSELF